MMKRLLSFLGKKEEEEQIVVREEPSLPLPMTEEEMIHRIIDVQFASNCSMELLHIRKILGPLESTNPRLDDVMNFMSYMNMKLAILTDNDPMPFWKFIWSDYTRQVKNAFFKLKPGMEVPMFPGIMIKMFLCSPLHHSLVRNGNSIREFFYKTTIREFQKCLEDAPGGPDAYVVKYQGPIEEEGSFYLSECITGSIHVSAKRSQEQ